MRNLTALSQEYRQAFLWDNFRLRCCCLACLLAGEERAGEEERRGEMMRLHHQLNTCTNTQANMAVFLESPFIWLRVFSLLES